MKSWALTVGKDNDITDRFLLNVRETIAVVRGGGDSVGGEPEVAEACVGAWVGRFEDVLSGAGRVIGSEEDFGRAGDISIVERGEAGVFGRAVIDVVLGASAMAYVEKDRKMGYPDTSINLLKDIWDAAACNLSVGWRLLGEYLDYVQIPWRALEAERRAPQMRHGLEGGERRGGFVGEPPGDRPPQCV